MWAIKKYNYFVKAALYIDAVKQQIPDSDPDFIYVFVEDADAAYVELRDCGARISKPPEDYAYGMRDFDVTDLDGNSIVFGSPG